MQNHLDIAQTHYLRALTAHAEWHDDDDRPLDAPQIQLDLAIALAAQPEHADARLLRLEVCHISGSKDHALIAEDARFLIAASGGVQQTVRAYGYLAMACEMAADHAQAVQVFEAWHQAIQDAPAGQTRLSERSEKDPLYANCLSEKAAFHQRQGHADLALQTYTQALAHAPDNTDLLHKTGLLAFAQGQFEQAGACFAGATVWPIESVYENHAVLLEKAIYEDHTHHPALCVAYAIILLDTHFARDDLFDMSNTSIFTKCIDLAQKTLASQPANSLAYNPARLILARAWYCLNDLHQSITYYEQYFANGADDVYSQARYMRARIQANLPFPPAFEMLSASTVAYEYYNVGVTVKELVNDKESAFAAPYLAFAKQNYQRSTALFQAYLDQGEGNAVNNQPHIAAMALHNLSNIVSDEAGGAAEALRLSQASLRYSVFGENSLNCALYLNQLERHDEAVAAFAGVLDLHTAEELLDAGDCYYWRHWGQSLLATQRWAQAVEVLEKACRVFKASPFTAEEHIENGYALFLNLLTDLCDAHARLGNRAAVKMAFEDALVLHPANPCLFNNYGWNCQEAGLFDDALAVYSRGIAACASPAPSEDCERGLKDLAMNRADLYFLKLNNTSAAIADYENLFTRDGSFVTAMRLIAAHHQAGDVGQARKFAAEADYWYWKEKRDEPAKMAQLQVWNATLSMARDTRAHYVKALGFMQQAIDLDPAQNTEALQAQIAVAQHKVATLRKKFLGLF